MIPHKTSWIRMCWNRQHDVFLYIAAKLHDDFHPTFLLLRLDLFLCGTRFTVQTPQLAGLDREEKGSISPTSREQKRKAFWIATSQNNIEKYKQLYNSQDFFYKPLVHHWTTIEALHGSNLHGSPSGGWLPNFPNSQWSLGSGCRFWRKWSYRNVFQVWTGWIRHHDTCCGDLCWFCIISQNIPYHHVWFIGFMMLMIWRCHAWSWDWSRPAFILFHTFGWCRKESCFVRVTGSTSSSYRRTMTW